MGSKWVRYWNYGQAAVFAIGVLEGINLNAVALGAILQLIFGR